MVSHWDTSKILFVSKTKSPLPCVYLDTANFIPCLTPMLLVITHPNSPSHYCSTSMISTLLISTSVLTRKFTTALTSTFVFVQTLHCWLGLYKNNLVWCFLVKTSPSVIKILSIELNYCSSDLGG